MGIYNILAMGLRGWNDISSDEEGDWIAIMPLNGDVTCGAGCEAKAGDALDDGDVLSQNQVYLGRFSKINYSGDGRLVGYPADNVT